MNEKAFVSIREASSITGIEAQTLRKLADQQVLPCYKTPAKQRMFSRVGLEAMCYPTTSNIQISKNKTNFVYTRVSTKKQMDDLSRQIDYIKCQYPEYSSYTFVSDIASGINFKRKGLSTILDVCLQGFIGEIVVAHRDRLSRFGFDLIELIVSKCGGKIIVLDDQGNQTSEQELSEDLLSIIHIYSCRQMGRRRYKSKCHESFENKDQAMSSTT